MCGLYVRRATKKRCDFYVPGDKRHWSNWQKALRCLSDVWMLVVLCFNFGIIAGDSALGGADDINSGHFR